MTAEFNTGNNVETLPELDPNKYKVIVDRFAEDGYPVETWWRLFKGENEDWTVCSRENPVDNAAFEHADQTSWLAFPIGEFTLTGMKLDVPSRKS